ncbi:MAG: hypothetical protein KF887_10870 [Paracoccaceae bacterium]|nr:MAG: hypothetical protein KF887_10870 [Paracoccaceae bacterium]
MRRRLRQDKRLRDDQDGDLRRPEPREPADRVQAVPMQRHADVTGAWFLAACGTESTP